MALAGVLTPPKTPCSYLSMKGLERLIAKVFCRPEFIVVHGFSF
jgi:hypothetical protein